MDVEGCTEVGGSWKGLRQGRGLRVTICSTSRLCMNSPSGVPGIVLGNIGIAKRKSWCCALLDTNHHSPHLLASWPLTEWDLERQVDGQGKCSRKKRIGPHV